MANLPELNEFTSGVYQIETADPVLGGVDGITNAPIKALANRTKWLKAQVDALADTIGDAISDADLLAAINKLPFKSPVVAATTTNITLSGLQTIDGVTLTAGQRVLVKNQSTAAQNGIWLAQTSAWTRADDMNEDAEVTPGMAVVVSGGTNQADSVWLLSTDGTVTVGTSPMAFKDVTGEFAKLASPQFTGNPTGPTAAQFDKDTSLATTEFVQRALGNARGFAGFTTNTTLTAAHAGMEIYASSTTGSITLTLPAANALPAGAKFHVINTGVSDVIVTRVGADTIVVNNTTNSVTAVTLKAGDSIVLTSLGTGGLWYHGGGTAQLSSAGSFSQAIRDSFNAPGAAPIYACRAWVNFNGTGAVAIRASGNVSSITDNGVGDYTMNFTTAMPDANYSVVNNAILSGGVDNNYQASLYRSASALSAGSCRMITRYSNVYTSTVDCDFVVASFFR